MSWMIKPEGKFRYNRDFAKKAIADHRYDNSEKGFVGQKYIHFTKPSAMKKRHYVKVNLDKIDQVKSIDIEDMKKQLREWRITKHREFIELQDLGDVYTGNTTLSGKMDIIKHEDLFGDSNKMLILITEAPSVSLMDWCTRVYNVDDKLETTIKKLVSTGYYNDDIWMNVIFQIMIIIKILNDHDLLVNYNHTDPRNISLFIKEQPQGVTNNPRGYYKFIVGGMTYFLPNYGFIVIFDPISVSEKPLNTATSTTSTTSTGAEGTVDQRGGNTNILRYEDPLFINPTPLFPIYNQPQLQSGSNINNHYKDLIMNNLTKIPDHDMSDKDTFFVYSEKLYKDKIDHSDQRSVYNRMIDKFLGFDWMLNTDFSLMGGIKFSSIIRDKLDLLKKALYLGDKITEEEMIERKKNDPSNEIKSQFKQFLHEKIGSYIYDYEKVLKDPPNYNFKDGQIIGYLDDEINGNTIYKWGIVSVSSKSNFSIVNGKISYKHEFKIIKRGTSGILVEEEFNQYYCKIPIDENSSPLYTIRSKEGQENIIDTYTVDNM